jgi:ABC-type Zn uptake system ZnuABC Zn-binding protein ZnuA
VAPPLEVVVSAYPLAQLVSYVGGKAVHVVNLAPPGVPPQGLSLTPAQRATVRSAPLVIDVGGGYQPGVEAAAASAHRHLSVLPAISKQAQPYEFWLDPTLMGKAATIIGTVLVAADPRARTQFQNGAEDFESVTGSIESDFYSTLTECTTHDFVTPDNAFSRMASAFDLVDVAVDTNGVKKTAALVAQDSLPAVFTEVGVHSSEVQQVARTAGVPVKSLDPMEVSPAPGTGAMSYFAVMEDNLTALEGPLTCDTSENYA